MKYSINSVRGNKPVLRSDVMELHPELIAERRLAGTCVLCDNTGYMIISYTTDEGTELGKGFCICTGSLKGPSSFYGDGN